MSALIQQFNERFHNLQGITIGERQKSLFQLINETKKNPQLQSQLDELIVSIQPITHLENTFKMHVLLQFKRVHELIDVLKSENWILISHVLRQPWFFQRLSQIYTPESLVNDLLVHTSFVVRTKVVNRLALHVSDTDYIDRFYDLFIKKYKIAQCKSLLSGCSPDKIRKVLSQNKIELSTEILLKIVKKDTDLIKHYSHFIDNSVLKYLMIHNNTVFCEVFLKQQNFRISCGKRTTSNLIKANKDLVVKEMTSFIRILNHKGVIKELDEDRLVDYCCSMFPNNSDSFSGYNTEGFFYYIKRCPKEKRVPFITKVFIKKYNAPMIFNPRIMDPKFVEDIWGIEERIKVVENMTRSPKDENKWLEYLEINKAMQLIKEKMNATSYVWEKKQLAAMLVKTCRINNSTAALLEVEKYICTQHRHDDPSVWEEFLNEIIVNYDSENLSDEHWHYIDMILTMLKSKSNIYNAMTVLLKRIRRCLLRNLPVTDYIKEYCKGVPDFNLQDPHILKQFTTLCYNTLPEVFANEPENLWAKDLSLLKNLIKWNKKCKTTRINIKEFPRLVDSLNNLIIKKVSCKELRYIFEYIICEDDDCFKKDFYMTSYFDIYNYTHNNKMNMWFLRHEPTYIAKHVNEFASLDILKRRTRFEYYFLKKYSNLCLPQQLIVIFLSKLDDDECTQTTKEEVIAALAVMMDGNDFLKFIVRYIPTEARVNLQSKEVLSLYPLQQAVACYLKHVLPPSLALPAVLNFCTGDYLRAALESLYYLFYWTPENKLKPFIQQLVDRAVSVKKHAIFLVCKVCSKQDAVDLIKRFTENETNVSIKQYIFKTCYSYFKENPSNELWNLLKLNINAFDETEVAFYFWIISTKNVPYKYMARYVHFVFNVLRKQEDRIPVLKQKKFELLNITDEKVFASLPDSFCNNIIKRYFLRTLKFEIQEFAIKYLFLSSYGDVRQKRFDTIFAIISAFKSVYESDNTNWAYANQISSFVSDVCSHAIDCDFPRFYDEMKTFANRWHDLFSEQDALKDYLKINMTLRIFESGERNYITLCAQTVELLDYIVLNYGEGLIDIVADATVDIMWSCSDDPAMKIKFVEELLKTTPTTSKTLFAIILFGKLCDFHSGICHKTTIIADLKKSTEPIVHIYLNRLLENL